MKSLIKNRIFIESFIKGIPKAELHLHIEGTCVKLRFKSVEELRAMYNFKNLQDFLDIYYKGVEVLMTEKRGIGLSCSDSSLMHAQRRS